jgi:hypothetical protein
MGRAGLIVCLIVLVFLGIVDFNIIFPAGVGNFLTTVFLLVIFLTEERVVIGTIVPYCKVKELGFCTKEKSPGGSGQLLTIET